MEILWVRETPALQTPNERIIYTYDTTNWIASPTSSSVKAYDETQGDLDVTTTVFPTNSPSEADNVITLSLLRELTINHVYRLEIKFVVDSGTYEFKDRVKCVRYYIIGSPLYQSADEAIAWPITTTAWTSDPSSPVATAYDQTQGDLNITTTVFPTNSPSVAGDVITLSPLESLTESHSYRINCKFTGANSQIFDPSMRVICPF
jgi:hypothetical protein